MDIHRRRNCFQQSFEPTFQMNGIHEVEDERKTQRHSVYVRIRKIPAIGILFGLLAAFFNASGNLLVKLVNDLHAVEIAVIRSSIQVICFLCFILITRASFRPSKGEHVFLFLRCVFGFIAVICVFFSLRMIPLGDSSAITYSAPVFVVIIARVFLKEKCDLLNGIALFTTAAGVVLITKPSFLTSNDADVTVEKHRLMGCLFAVGGAFGTAFAYVSLRKLQKTPSTVVVFWHSLFAVLVGTVILLLTNEAKLVYELRNILLLLAMGLCSTFSQLCVTIAFKLEEAGPVSLARTFSIVIAFLYQVFILNEPLVWSSLVGATIVVLSVLSVTLRKWFNDKSKERSDTFLDVENISSDIKEEKFSVAFINRTIN